jgi:serine/threonine-protein kinase
VLQPGQLIDDKYRVLRLVGEGGMGAVYEAEHAFLERRVAIKVLAPGMGENADVIRRFYQEAKAAAKIGHENICEVTDVGQTAGGMPYIVMQLLHGRSLGAEIAALGPLGVERAVDVATQALGALSAAHAAGIVHRDMKPDNIFLTRAAGRDDFVKVLDFGISKVRSAGGSGGIGLTKTGTVLGTPAYMSPEQARGETDVDARADVWAMGVVVYEMLVGKPPFEGANYNQVIYSVIAEPIVPPRSVRADVPADLDAVVMRALERDPSKRFASADAFSGALASATAGGAERGGDDGITEPRAGGTVAPAREDDSVRPETLPSGQTLGARLSNTTVQAAPGVWTRIRSRPVPAVAVLASLAAALAVAFVLVFRGDEGGSAPPAWRAASGASVAERPGAASRPTPAAMPAAGTTVVGGGLATGRPTALAAGPATVDRPGAQVADLGGGPAADAGSQRDGAAPSPAGRDVVAAPRAVGSLTVVAPAHTELFLDGTAVGEAPLSRRAVAAGPHRLRFLNPAMGIDREEAIRIEAGRETVIRRAAGPPGGHGPAVVASTDAAPVADAGTAEAPPATDAGAGRDIVIRREAGPGVVSGGSDAGGATAAPNASDGGLIRIRRDKAGGQP